MVVDVETGMIAEVLVEEEVEVLLEPEVDPLPELVTDVVELVVLGTLAHA
jgi:hypothetical protein